MKYSLLLLSILPVICSSCFGQFTYINPLPGTGMHPIETGIILRTGKQVDATSLRHALFLVEGSQSGLHSLQVKLGTDQKSILIDPLEDFRPGESVMLRIDSGIQNSDGSVVKGTRFQFHIREDVLAEEERLSFQLKPVRDADEGTIRLEECEMNPPFEITATAGAFYDEPVFYRNHVADPALGECWYVSIVSSSGDSIYGHYNQDVGFDFKLNDNGYLTYFNKEDSCIDMLDSSYQVVKKFKMGNGYSANKHEFRVYPNGYYFMICYDEQVKDMTPYGGKPNAVVTGLVIQQLDPDDDVIFEWRSWDHFEYTDAANDIALTTNAVDYVHGNSLDLDSDGNLLLSSRNLDEITKIDLNTGNIIWRMGGKNNEFTFLNNPVGPKPFSHQHHFRLLPNGHYSMFDNANYQNPERSVAKEFVLDQVNKTATLVWSYYHPPINGFDVYGSALGSVQLLPNGHRLINWGQIAALGTFTDMPHYTEVDSNGIIVWEFRFLDSTNVTYRAHKFPWDRCNLVADSSMAAANITNISADLQWNDHSKISSFALQYRECNFPTWQTVTTTANFWNLTGLLPNTCYEWRVKSECAMYADSFITSVKEFTTLNPVGWDETRMISFEIYPNPVSDMLYLTYCAVSRAGVAIYDASGLLVYRQEIPASSVFRQTTLNVQQLRAGVYTVELQMAEGVQRKKLVVY